jgi:hypothetical protein
MQGKAEEGFVVLQAHVDAYRRRLLAAAAASVAG